MQRFIVIAILSASLILGGCGRMHEFQALLDDVNSALLSIAVLNKAN